jgi:GTP diphosphokinase / guanosine-3',5'-bis(diphosphate) 3'-diphosphatase
VQIRTSEMHHLAESGVASHWMYKDDSDKLSELQKQTHRWLQSLLEIQHQSGDPHEFLEHVKVDLFPDEVYVFTPKGKILSLPRGATAVDFAYAVHTDIGNRCVAAKVNGELVPLRTELRNGDRVEVITASHAKPNPGWLQYVRTGKARSNIRHFLKTMQYEESAGLGERLLDQALKALKSSLAEVDEASWERALRDGGMRSRGELLADIGLGKRLPAVVARRLVKRAEGADEAYPAGSVTIRGTEGMAVQLATCCRPIPGDAIVGSIKKGQGLVVHASECGGIVRSRKKEPEQWIDVEWDAHPTRLFQAAINVTVENQRGVLAKVASEIAEAASNIDAISMEEDRFMYTTMRLVLEVANRQHLARVMRALHRLPDVKRISRMKE